MDSKIPEEEAKDNDEKSAKSEDFDTDLDETDETNGVVRVKVKENCDIGHHSYTKACRLLGTAPRRKIIKQLMETEICLQHYGLNTSDVIALSHALQHNNRAEKLDLKDNGLTDEGMQHILDALHDSVSISSLSFSENRMSPETVMILGDTLSTNSWLSDLDLSGCHLGDNGSTYIGFLIENNISLKRLNLHNNEIGEIGAKNIGKVLSVNNTLKQLDLSWNHIRGIGAVDICQGLEKNSAISDINLAWNGLAYEGSIGIEEALKQNVILEILDISNNRINWEGVLHLSKGLRGNNVLKVLKIGGNPINTEGCQKLLESINSGNSKVTRVDFQNIPVKASVTDIAAKIAQLRPFSISHGPVLDSDTNIGIKKVNKMDAMTHLMQFIGARGMRLMDLFRMIDTDNDGIISIPSFVKGLKKIGLPILEQEMRSLGGRLDDKGDGTLTYRMLANGLKKQVRKNREHDRHEAIQVRKRQLHRKSLLNMGFHNLTLEQSTKITFSLTSMISRLEQQSSYSISSVRQKVSTQSSGLPVLPIPNNRRSTITAGQSTTGQWERLKMAYPKRYGKTF